MERGELGRSGEELRIVVENNRAFVSRLPFLVVLVILALATICAAAVQLSERVPLSPWESAVIMEAVRLNAGLPVYETAHATHMYGPLLTVLLAGVFQVFGFNVLAALLAIVALYFWATRKSSLLLSLASIALFLCATLCKQTSAAFALIPFVYTVMWRRPLQVRELVPALAPTISILLALAAIRSIWRQMFAAMVTIPASIKVYPERAFNVSLYLFATFPIFLIALWSIWRSRHAITPLERWILSALVVLIPISIWTICKSGGGYNSLLFAYLAMTALFAARLDGSSAGCARYRSNEVLLRPSPLPWPFSLRSFSNSTKQSHFSQCDMVTKNMTPLLRSRAISTALSLARRIRPSSTVRRIISAAHLSSSWTRMP